MSEQVMSVASRYMVDSGNEHQKVVVQILRYLSGTADYSLLHGVKKEDDVRVVGFVDSAYARDLGKKRSLTGYFFTLSNCTINQKASLQSVIASSITEAEYSISVKAMKKAIWLKRMVTELGYEHKQMMVHYNSQNAIYLSKNHIHH